jgi:hypothetical protein
MVLQLGGWAGDYMEMSPSTLLIYSLQYMTKQRADADGQYSDKNSCTVQTDYETFLATSLIVCAVYFPFVIPNCGFI